MEESHLLQVAEIENKCFSHPWSLKSLESELKNNGSHFYVSVEDDKVLGYIGMNVVVDEGYILMWRLMKTHEKGHRYGFDKYSCYLCQEKQPGFFDS